MLATTGSEEPPQSAPLPAPWCRPLRPREFYIDIQIFDADIFRSLENIPATAEITVDNSTIEPKDPLLERILSGFDTGLGTGLVLVGGPTADADRADLHLVLSHDRQSAGKRNNAGD